MPPNINFGLQQKIMYKFHVQSVCYLKTEFGKVDGAIASAPGHKMSQREATGIPVLQ